MLESLRTLGPVSLLNVPEGDAAAGAVRALGGQIALRQRELTLAL